MVAKEMEKCVRRLKKKARYGETLVRISVHQDIIDYLEELGFTLDNPRIPMNPKKCKWKNPVKITVYLSSPQENSYAERVYKLCEKHRRKNADKARTSQRKRNRSILISKKIRFASECKDCTYRRYCEDYSGKRCEGFVEDIISY